MQPAAGGGQAIEQFPAGDVGFVVASVVGNQHELGRRVVAERQRVQGEFQSGVAVLETVVGQQRIGGGGQVVGVVGEVGADAGGRGEADDREADVGDGVDGQSVSQRIGHRPDPVVAVLHRPGFVDDQHDVDGRGDRVGRDGDVDPVGGSGGGVEVDEGRGSRRAGPDVVGGVGKRIAGRRRRGEPRRGVVVVRRSRHDRDREASSGDAAAGVVRGDRGPVNARGRGGEHQDVVSIESAFDRASEVAVVERDGNRQHIAVGIRGFDRQPDG